MCCRHRTQHVNSSLLEHHRLGCRSGAGASTAHNTTPISLLRSEGRVECSAASLYALLMTTEGYKLLDPHADPAEFENPTFGPFPFGCEGDGKPGGKVRVEHATMKVILQCWTLLGLKYDAIRYWVPYARQRRATFVSLPNVFAMPGIMSYADSP